MATTTTWTVRGVTWGDRQEWTETVPVSVSGESLHPHTGEVEDRWTLDESEQRREAERVALARRYGRGAHVVRSDRGVVVGIPIATGGTSLVAHLWTLTVERS